MPCDFNVASGRGSPLHLKNSICVAREPEFENRDPVERPLLNTTHSADHLALPEVSLENPQEEFFNNSQLQPFSPSKFTLGTTGPKAQQT